MLRAEGKQNLKRVMLSRQLCCLCNGTRVDKL